MKTVTLYRPVGEKEMILIIESNYKAFPKRLDWQPIFYPVLNEEYAIQIARDWNTNDEFGNYLGFITKFDILETEYLKYEVQNVGGEIHNELWIPAENLEKFNRAIKSSISVTKVFKGQKFEITTDARIEDLIAKVL